MHLVIGHLNAQLHNGIGTERGLLQNVLAQNWFLVDVHVEFRDEVLVVLFRCFELALQFIVQLKFEPFDAIVRRRRYGLIIRRIDLPVLVGILVDVIAEAK